MLHPITKKVPRVRDWCGFKCRTAHALARKGDITSFLTAKRQFFYFPVGHPLSCHLLLLAPQAKLFFTSGAASSSGDSAYAPDVDGRGDARLPKKLKPHLEDGGRGTSKHRAHSLKTCIGICYGT